MTSADPDCLFCKIIAGQVPATLVAETADSVAFRDINPQAPTHVLVVSREHHADVAALATADAALAGRYLADIATIAKDLGAESFRLVFNTGADAQQSVFHVHGHVVAGRPMTWPPG